MVTSDLSCKYKNYINTFERGTQPLGIDRSMLIRRAARHKSRWCCIDNAHIFHGVAATMCIHNSWALWLRIGDQSLKYENYTAIGRRQIGSRARAYTLEEVICSKKRLRVSEHGMPHPRPMR